MSSQGGPASLGISHPHVTAQQQQMQILAAQQANLRQQMAANAGGNPLAGNTVASGDRAHVSTANIPSAVASGTTPMAPPSATTIKPSPDPALQGLPIRAYLDQTVVPILLDGKFDNGQRSHGKIWRG